MARSSTERVLSTYIALGAASRPEVARKTGISLPTVGEATALLMEHGVLVPVCEVPSKGGRPALLFGIQAGRFTVAAADLDDSGTLTCALGDLDGRVLAIERFRSEVRSPDEVFGQLLTWARTQEERASEPLCLVIGAPGIVDPATKSIRVAVHLKWRDVDVGKAVGSLRYPVHVISRATLYAVAEARRLTEAAPKTAIYLWVGSAIGGALIRSGVPQVTRQHPPEFGHIVVRVGGALCHCGNRGCFEAEYSQLKSDQLEQRAEVLAAGITSLINLYAPDLVVLGGPDIAEQPRLVPMVQELVRGAALPGFADAVTLRPAETIEYPHITGALIRARDLAAGIIAERIESGTDSTTGP